MARRMGDEATPDAEPARLDTDFEPPRAPRWSLSRIDWRALGVRVRAWGRSQIEADVWSSILHVLLLMALLVLLRPAFFEMSPAEVYEADNVFAKMVDRDLSALAAGSQKHRPAVPSILFLAIPTVLLLLARRGLRWTDWEHGRELRIVIILPLAMLAWSASTFPYNTYLDQGHPWDRLLVVAATVASWYTPLAVPIATRFILVMLKEAYIPIKLDDFDFRAVGEYVVVASIFVWAAAASRSFKAKHFVVMFVSSWAGYYFCAGVAKWNYGPEHSWLLENHLTNISVGSYVRGWMSWLDESTYMSLIALLRHTDVAMAVYTLIIEVGAIVGFLSYRRLAKWWFLGSAFLNFGIFTLTGICFWKWIFANLVFAWWFGGDGRRVVSEAYRQKLVLLVGALSVYLSTQHYRVLYWSTKVAWYDTRVTQDYEIWAIGESGEEYLVDPKTITPMEMHWVQGAFCYATNDHALTGIYATSGNYNVMKKLESFERPADALRLFQRSKTCRHKKRKMFDDFMIRYFGHLNRDGRKHGWIDWIGRPTHLWVFPKGNLYEEQERVQRIELRRQLVYHHGEKLHELDDATVHTVDIPLNGPPKPKPKAAKGRAR
jgi:hypothetical protein